MTYRVIFFDAGETLVRPYPSFADLFARVVGSEGIALEPDSVTACLPLVAGRFEEVARSGESWTTSPERSERFWLSVYGDLLGSLGIASTNGLAEELYATFSDPANYRLFPDVLPALRGLSADGFTMGIISNFEAWLDGLLGALGVDVYFPVRVISGIEGMEKPDPRIFEIALERADVEAADAVYVGDNPKLDIEAAAAVGMTPVLIDRSGRHPGHDGLRIESMLGLKTVIGS